jgi:lysophospholipid acyltransferase (LPLAT)-like uncharacterized protein
MAGHKARPTVLKCGGTYSSLGEAPGILANCASLSSTIETPRPKTKARVHAISGWRWLAMWPLVRLVRWWGRSLRFEMTPEDVANCAKCDEPVAFILWHNRLFLASEIHRRFRPHRPLYALISASKDGAWLTAFFSMVGGLRAVRGSSSNFGREAASALVDVLREGNDIGITPDGPRGPCYDLKPGAVIVPRRSGAPLLLVGGDFESAWQLRSWDRFYLPKPFSRVRLRCELMENETLVDRDAALAQLKVRLLALNPDRTPQPAAVV